MSNKGKVGGRLLTEEELAELKARLILPDHVVEHLRHQPRLSPLANGSGIALFIVLMGGLGITPLATYSPGFGRLLLDIGFLPQDTILVEQNFFAPLPAVFAAIFVAGYLLFIGIRSHSDLYARSIVSNLYQAVEPGQRYRGAVIAIMRWFLKGIDRTAGAEEYLRQFERRQARFFGRGALVLYFTAFLLFPLDLRSLVKVSPDGVNLSTYFSGRILNYVWPDIVSIKTKCYTSGGRHSGDYVVYRLEFNDNRKIDLGSYTALRMTIIEALEIIDGKLAALDVPKVKGEFEQSCLDAKRREFGPRDYERLMRVLQDRTV